MNDADSNLVEALRSQCPKALAAILCAIIVVGVVAARFVAIAAPASGGWRVIKAPFAGDAVLYIHTAQDKGRTR